MSALLEVDGLEVHYAVRGARLFGGRRMARAVDGVSLRVARGETLALVGESGCGKSTIARAILCLLRPTAGRVILAGRRIDDMAPARLRPLRRQVQIVFQDPLASLDPRMRIRDSLAEPIRNFALMDAGALDRRLDALADMVGLPREALDRFPHEFSGGQRQRICIARALAAEPDLLVCDEAVSALDLSVKARIVDLLGDLQRDLGLAMLFISHDLAVVERIAKRVAVMYLGKIVETGETPPLFARPRHPYTRALLSAAPSLDPDAPRGRDAPVGETPSPIDAPAGCRFHTRCRFVFDRCRSEEPPLKALSPGHEAACHLNDRPPEANPLLTEHGA